MKMTGKAKLFHAGRGLWEIRHKTREKGRTKLHGIGYFFTKRKAKQIINKINKKKNIIK